MSRAAVGIDRFLGVLVGILLIVVGVAGILWWHGTLYRHAPSVGVHTHGVLLSLRNATGTSWWPWVAGLVGLVLGLLALLWLLRHATSRGVHRLRLRGSDKTGRVTASTSSLFDAATEDLVRTPGIRAARGTMTAQRGALIADLHLTIDPAAELSQVSSALDQAVRDLAGALDNPDITYRATASVARRPRVNA